MKIVFENGQAAHGYEGSVFAALDELGRRVAVKFLHTDNPVEAGRLIEQGRVLCTVEHPNVVRVYTLETLVPPGQEAAQPALILEHIDGESLDTWMERPHAKAEMFAVLKHLISAVAAFHKKERLHGDLQPRNILISTSGLKLIDPGPQRDLAFADADTVAAEIDNLSTLMIKILIKHSGTTAAIGQLSKPVIHTLADLEAQLEELFAGSRARADNNFVTANVFRNPDFVGRDDLQEKVRQQLLTGSAVVVGPGGIGKSQVAIALALESLDRFDGVWWIHASKETYEASIDRLARDFGFEARRDTTRDELEAFLRGQFSHGTHMVVLDDVTEPSVVNAFRLEDTLHLLVTSKRTDFPPAIAELIHVPPLEDDAAIQLLIGHRPDLNDAHLRPDAIRVVRLLDCHPLAVALAAAYLLKRPNVDLRSFIERLNAAEIGDEAGLLSAVDPRRDVAAPYPLGVARTLAIHFDDLSSTTQEILKAISFCHNDGIPLTLLKEIHPEMPGDLASTEDALIELAKFSIIRFGKSARIHSLTQSAVRARMSETERKHVLDKLLSALRRIIVNVESDNFLITHTTTAFHFAKAYVDLKDLAFTAVRSAAIYYRLKRFNDALDCLDIADQCDSGPEMVGPNDVALQRNLTGYHVHAEIGQYQLAEEMLYNYRNIAVKMRQFDDKSKAAYLVNLGFIGLHTDRLDLAFSSYSESLELSKAIFGENSKNVAIALAQIAGVYKYNGQYDEALKNLDRSVEIDKALSGDNSWSLALRYAAIGSIHSHKLQPQTAIDWLTKAQEIFESDPGYKDSHYARCLNDLGMAYHGCGDLDNALEFHTRALAWHQRTYGDMHPDVAIAISNIGSLHFKKGNVAQALENYEMARRIDVALFGEAHSRIGHTENNIGMVCFVMGRRADAIGHLKKALSITLRCKGPAHLETLQVALSLQMLGCDIHAFVDSELGKRAADALSQSVRERGVDAINYFNQRNFTEHEGVVSNKPC